jgi:hypothetical protein
MVSNLLKSWRDDFETVKRQRDGFGLFEKKRDAIPFHPAPPESTGYNTENHNAHKH